LAFASQKNLGGSIQPKISRPGVKQFLNPSTGIEKGED